MDIKPYRLAAPIFMVALVAAPTLVNAAGKETHAAQNSASSERASTTKLAQLINDEIKQSKQYLRMYALGVDSFQLHPRLRQLELIPNSRVYGQTGTLKLNDEREIERQMLLAQIKNGRAKIIPLVDQSLNQLRESKDGLFDTN